MLRIYYPAEGVLATQEEFCLIELLLLLLMMEMTMTTMMMMITTIKITKQSDSKNNNSIKNNKCFSWRYKHGKTSKLDSHKWFQKQWILQSVKIIETPWHKLIQTANYMIGYPLISLHWWLGGTQYVLM